MTDLNKLGTPDRLAATMWIMLIAILPLEHVPAARLSLLLALLLFLLISEPKKIFSGYELTIPLFAWAAFCAATWFWSIKPQLTFSHLKSDLLPSIVAFIIFFRIAQKNWAATGMSFAMLSCSLSNGLIALLGHFAGIHTAKYLYADVGFSSTIAVVTLAYAVAHLLFNPKNKLAWLILSFSLLTGLISANRMFIVISAPLLLILFVQLTLYRRRILPFALFAGALVITYALVSTQESTFPVIGVIQSKFRMMGSGNDPRLSIWMAWIDFANFNPWFGIGYGRSVGQFTFGSTFSEMLLKIDSLAIMHSHNIFINSYVETGAIGLTLFILMWGFSVFRFGKLATQNVDAMAGLLIVMTFLAKNQTDIFFLKSTMPLILGLIGFYLAKTREVIQKTRSAT